MPHPRLHSLEGADPRRQQVRSDGGERRQGQLRHFTQGSAGARSGKTVRWKEGIVDKLDRGVAGLLRKAKVQVVRGRAEFSDAKTCEVRTEAGPVTIRPEHVILATGSTAIPLPGVPFGGAVISSTEALSLQSSLRGSSSSEQAISAWSSGSPIASSARKLP